MRLRPGQYLVFAVLMLLAVPVAQAQTRAAPPGDNVSDPILMALNTTKTVRHVEEATLQLVVEETSCDPSDQSSNSIWFAFTMPVFGHVDIDGNGAFVELETGVSSFVVMSLYNRTAPPGEIDCTISDIPRMLFVGLQPGDYLVRIANYFDVPVVGPSQYRLSLRARFAGDFMQDNSFETQPLGAPWKVKKAGDPSQVTRICAATCSVRFNGKAKAAIQQSASIDGKVYKGKKGDFVIAGAQINNTPVTGADVKITLEITYSDGTPGGKASMTRHITQTTTGDTAQSFGSLHVEIRSKAVKSMKLTISSPKAIDTFNITEAYVVLLAGGSVRGGVLPVPPVHHR